MVKVQLPYGSRDMVTVDLPITEDQIIAPKPIKPARDPEAVIAAALDNPLGTGGLESIVKAEHRINIICDDITRPTPCHLILPILLERLLVLGVERSNIRIIMALGSHRYMTEAEIIRKVGEEIYQQYTVVNSEFKREEDLVSVGTTAEGVDITVSKVALDADIKIGIGNIVPHPAMGWSGGAKIVFPGVASEETVKNFHIYQGLSDENLYGLDECFIRTKVEQWTELIGLDFIINTVLDAEGRIYRVVAGDYRQAHRQGVKYAKEIYHRPIREKADVVVVSSYPVDIDLWQSTKGYLCGDHALKGRQGGTIILVSPNYEGVGPHPEYVDYIGRDSDELLLEVERGGHFAGDPLALAIGNCVSKIRRRRNLVLVSDGITKAEAEKAKLVYYPKAQLQEAVDRALAQYENPRVLVITHGGETLVS